MVRRINRYKTLLGENVVNQDDELASTKDQLENTQKELYELQTELQQYKDG